MEFNTHIQLIGFAAAAVAFVVFQSNRRHRILLLQIFANLMWTIHFFLLGANSGAAMNFLSVFRNYIYFRAGKNRSISIPIVVALAFVAAALLTWHGIYSVFPLTASLIGVVAFWQLKTHHIRLIALTGPSL